MKLNRIHAVIGLLLVLVPFMAFSREFKTGFSMLAGVVILYFAINSIHIELRKKHRRPHRHDTFMESRPPQPEQKLRSEEEQKLSPVIDSEPTEILVEKVEIIEEPVLSHSPISEEDGEPEL